MNYDENPRYKRLDFWYTQLFNWIAIKSDYKEKLIELIVGKCQENLRNIEHKLNGKFEKGSVEYRHNYIRFPDILFELKLKDNTLKCISKIRINPCIKIPLFVEKFQHDINMENLNEIKALFDKRNILLTENSLIRKSDTIYNDDVFELISDGSVYILRKIDNSIEVYSKQTAPYYSKILVSTKSIFEPVDQLGGGFSEAIKEEFFDEMEKISIELCKSVSDIYVNDIHGGAMPLTESKHHGCVHQIEIKSAATDDERLLDLLVDKSKQNRLRQILRENIYINNIVDGLLSSLCGEKIDNWRTAKSKATCTANSKWKLVTAEDAKGLYATTDRNDLTVTSAIFHYKNKKHSNVYDILRSWALDLNVIL